MLAHGLKAYTLHPWRKADKACTCSVAMFAETLEHAKCCGIQSVPALCC